MIQILARMFRAEANVRVGGKVHYQIRAFYGLRESFAVKQICLVKNKLRMPGGALQEALLSGGQVVEANHPVSRGQKSIDHVAADKTSRTRNENPQSNLQ
ncbi:MAG: hypothetical protein WCB59_23400 [Candidatus Sulfotelmatobacter sp.]